MSPQRAGRWARRIVALAAWIAPSDRRARFRREWGAELSHVEERAGEPPTTSPAALRRRQPGPVRWSVGAMRHAAWLRARAYAPDTLWFDIRHAGRRLRHQPTTAALAVAILALGVGANTAVYSVAEAALLRPFPYPGADRLVDITIAPESSLGWLNGGGGLVPYRAYELWRDADLGIEAIAAYTSLTPTLAEAGDPARVNTYAVSSSFWAMTGARPEHGRLFGADDDGRGGANRAILSHEIWRTRFGEDPAIVGRSIRLDDELYEVVGVLPADFRYSIGWIGGRLTDVWLSLSSLPVDWQRSSMGGFWALARLRPEVTVARFNETLRPVSAALIRELGRDDQVAHATPLRTFLAGDVRRPLTLMLVGVALVLLIAAANVANLLLARTLDRRAEIRLRMALGSGTMRLLRGTVIESLMLGLLGGAVGVITAFATVPVLVRLGAEELPPAALIGIDGRVMAVGLLLATLAGGVAALPALHVRRFGRSTHTGLVQAAGASRRSWSADVLVLVQVALTVALLTGATAVLDAIRSGWTHELGFDADDAVAVQVDLPRWTYADAESEASFARRLHDRVAALASVRQAAVGTAIPFGGWQISSIRLPGEPDDTSLPWAHVAFVDDRYFDTLRIPLLRGRLPGPGGLAAGEIAIDEAAAEAYFDGDPIGHELLIGGLTNPKVVVGVVGNVRQERLYDSPEPHVYRPLGGQRSGGVWVVARAGGEPGETLEAMREAVWEVDAEAPLLQALTLRDLVAETLGRHRFYGALLTVFAAIGVTIAAAGVGGSIAHAVSGRTREIGIRVAIGARGGAITRLVVGRAALVSLAGLVLGGLAAAWTTRALASILEGIRPGSPTALGATTIVLLCVGAVACWLPVRRALRLDPMTTLRE